MRILVVDDQEGVGIMLSEITRYGNWESAYSSDALQVLNAVDEYEPDVLIIDQFMPGKNGLEIVAELRAGGNHLPVILFSGHPDGIDFAEVARLGIEKFLPKPIGIRELRGILKEIAASLPRSARRGPARNLPGSPGARSLALGL